MFARRSTTSLVLALMLMISLPGVAFGHVYYQGDDYSVPTDGRHRMGVCDHERDFNEAYSKFHLYDGSLHTHRDGNGATPPCSVTLRYGLTVLDHKTCEARTFRPDVCNKVYRP